MKHVFRFNGIEWSADVKDAEKFNEEVLIMLEGFNEGIPTVLIQDIFRKPTEPSFVEAVLNGKAEGIIPVKVVWTTEEMKLLRTEPGFIGCIA